MAAGRKANALTRVASEPVSRRRFIALGGGSAAAALLAACGEDSSTSATATDAGGDAVIEERFGKGDAGIVSYLLTLEYLQAEFFLAAAKSGLFKGADLTMLEEFGGQHSQHLEAWVFELTSIGAKPVPEPKTEFPLKDAEAVLELARTMENLAAAAYLGQLRSVKRQFTLAEMLSIHSVEGRQAAALNTMRGESITPDGAFAHPADAEAVLAFVDPFLIS